MATVTRSTSESIRARLRHPVIDADGHLLENMPVLVDYVSQVGGPDLGRAYQRTFYTRPTSSADVGPSQNASPQERADRRAVSPVWWTRPTANTLDRATSHLPRLLYNRLDEFGFDFAVMYPSECSSVATNQNDEIRRAACRGYNHYVADMYREFSDRITPAAIIPMHTPEEAITELEHAVKVLGLKVMIIAGHVRRPIRAIKRQHPDLQGVGEWIDTFGIDSEYDYDPVWAKCVELGVAPSQHTTALGWGARTSVTNWMYNHSGYFAVAGEALCKSLFMGGVTRRFPTLNFAFMEGGVAWGCELLTQMVFRWEKRNPQALLKHLDPALLNLDALIGLFERYADPRTKAKIGEIRESLAMRDHPKPGLDDWAAARITRVEEIRELFEPRFYFGCEGEDPLVPWAFNTKANPLGARLRPLFGSDIGHWDVTDMKRVLEEAYEGVEKELLTEDDFRDFVFTNPVRLYGEMNPNFFKGTSMESQAAEVLRQEG